MMTNSSGIPAVRGPEVRAMFDSIASRYDVTNSVLSLGVHHLWRQTLIALVPPASNKVALDLCSGTGDLLPLLQSRFGTAIGADFCLPMMQAGQEKLARQGRAVTFVQADALHLPFGDEKFDILTVAFGVRNLENLKAGLTEMRRLLKPGGDLLVLEFGQPRWKPFAAFYRFYSTYCMPVVGGLITGNRAAYTYLPKTAQAFPCGKVFEGILHECGYLPQKTVPLTFGIAYAYHAKRG